MSNEDLAEKTGAYPEAIERIRQEIEQGKKEETSKLLEEQKEPKADIDLNLIQQEENNRSVKTRTPISAEDKKTDTAEADTNNVLSQNRIWSSEKIREKLKQPGAEKMSNAVWAKWAGVSEETIAGIRGELEKDEKSEEQLSGEKAEEIDQEERKDAIQIEASEPTEETNLSEPQSSQEAQNEALIQRKRLTSQILKYGRKGMEISEIAGKTGVSIGSVSQRFREHGIWNITRIRKELKAPGAEKRSNASWASLTGVDIETIARIREEIRAEEAKNSQEIKSDEVQSRRPYTSRSNSFKERLSISRSGKLQITQEADDVGLEAEETSTVTTYQAKAREYPKDEQELAEELGISVGLIKPIKSRLSTFPAVAAIAKEYKVSREIVEKILEIIKKEQYDRTHTVVQYRAKMNDLRGMVGREIKDKISATVLEHEVDILINEFTSFLTQNDYTFLAYRYAKARSYTKAIQVGEEHLELDMPSISALEQRIQELLQKGLDDKEKQEVTKTFKILSGGNGDER